ncbi:thioredoxin-like fold protein [Vibrio phage 1.121.O._10N.286.46.C4]|nr:thioredoxin-like fold protein [Vibrio phage 1.121.O._10N.286.46.C4]
MYLIYSKDGCRFCENAVQAVSTFKVKASVLKVDKDFTREEFLNLFVGNHNHHTFPAILYIDPLTHKKSFVGGFTEFKTHLGENYL